MQAENVKNGTYIVAVSGGVDSMVLLHYLFGAGHTELIVAHFDHGIRQDSAEDKELVEKTAKKYNLAFETATGHLGAGASEQQAREKRYDFLGAVRKKYSASAIMTAHHADDVVETMIINLLRGSGWRGLCSLRSGQKIIRPFLSISKKDIIAYARQHNITWREDSTNQDTKYLRNQVRFGVMPLVNNEEWLDLYKAQIELSWRIKSELSKHRFSKRRYDFIMWPPEVALEVLRRRFSITRPQARRVLMAIKTARSGHRLIIADKELTFTPDEFVIR